MGDRRGLQSLELQQKLCWHTDNTRDDEQAPSMPMKPRRILPENRRQPQRTKDKPVANILRHTHFGECDLAEQKSSTPEAASSSEACDWPDATWTSRLRHDVSLMCNIASTHN